MLTPAAAPRPHPCMTLVADRRLDLEPGAAVDSRRGDSVELCHINLVRYIASRTLCGVNRPGHDVQALEYLGLEGQSKWAFIGYETLFFCFFFGCAWAAVQFIRWDRR